jgi:predicted N-acetyltransferase YhbS
VATPADIDALNDLFSQAFTERYQRDGMAGVRVPLLNPRVWRYALDDAGAGAMVWRESGGAIVAFNFVHLSGREGWMGPLAVRTDRQGRGTGIRVVRAGIEFLRGHGATVIGLETMPRTVDNIGFYSRLGFRPGHLTVTVSREVAGGEAAVPVRLSHAGPAAAARLAECTALTARLRPGADYSRELVLTAAGALGDTSLIVDDGVVRGFALWHNAPLAAGRTAEELRVLKVVAEDRSVFTRLVAGLGAEAAGQGLERLTMRAETARAEPFAELIQGGFQVLWTDLRMTLDGYPESPAGAAILFSNWEI